MLKTKSVWTFAFSSESSYRLLRYVAKLAVEKERTIALLYLGTDDVFYSTVLADANLLNAEARSIELELKSLKDIVVPERKSLYKKIKAFLLNRTARYLENPSQVIAFKAAYASRRNAIYQVLTDLSSDTLFCSEDGISSDLCLFSAARILGLKVVDIPYGNGTKHELEVDLARKKEEGRLIVASGLPLVLIKLLAPQWLKKGAFKNALMFTPEMIFAWELLDITLRDAWIIHGGCCDLLCSENEISHQQYLSEGIPAKKIKETGSPYCDVMVDSLRKHPVAADSIKKPKPIDRGSMKVLVSWPPSYHETYPGLNEFESYEEMTKVILSYINGLPNVELTVSLHPACSLTTKVLLKDNGIRVSSDYLLELIPLNDVFVTYFSSTIRWALAAGKIVVNYDAYRIGIKSFDSAPGFLNAMDFQAFRNLIENLLIPSEFERISQRQIPNSETWGVLDGRCTERIFFESEGLVL